MLASRFSLLPQQEGCHRFTGGSLIFFEAKNKKVLLTGEAACGAEKRPGFAPKKSKNNLAFRYEGGRNHGKTI